MAEKRNRSANWSKNEKSLLKNLVFEYDSVLSHKHTNEITNKKKKEVWEYITNQINLLGVCRRTTDEVKTRWSNESRHLKKQFSAQRKSLGQTGGGPPPVSPSSEDGRFINLFKDRASFRGVDGGLDLEPCTAEGCMGQTLPNSSNSAASLMIVDYENSASEEDGDDDQMTQQNLTETQAPVVDIPKTLKPSTKARSQKNKKPIKAEDVYKKQLEVLEVELKNKKLETTKLQLQIKLLERLDREKDQESAQEILNSILLQ